MPREFPSIPEQPTEIVQTPIDWEVTRRDIDWSDDSLLDLPEGVKSEVLNTNGAERRVDQIHRYPPGYVEPEHWHETAHAVLVLEGTLVIDGRELGPGDYVYGQKEPHGPSTTPTGCTIFASFVGGDITHDWDEESEDVVDDGDP